MRIAIDLSPAVKPHRTGVARYATSLVRALAALGTDDEFVLCYRLSRWPKREHRVVVDDPRFTERWIQGPLRPRVDLVHTTDGRVRRWLGARSVVTLHDVFSLESSDFADESFQEKRARQYAATAEHADRIICVSEYTSRAFAHHHPGAAEKCFVIPEGVDERFRPEAVADSPGVRERLGIEGPYLLFVGQLSVRKNVRGMLDAIAGLPSGSPRLVLAGKPSFGHGDLEQEIRSRGLSDRVVLPGYVVDDDLPGLYAGADLLLFPSLLEGFGLPVLEAMACGTPVVVSDRGALPETAGDAALIVDPEEAGAIGTAVERILGDDGLRADLRERGLARARGFGWEEVARRTHAVYGEVAS